MTDSEPGAELVITRDRYIISGGENLAFYQALHEDMPVNVIDIDYETATPDERDRLRKLAAALGETNIESIGHRRIHNLGIDTE